MTLKTKPISTAARSMLATLKDDPQYLRHFYDEQNEYILVTMKRWAGTRCNHYALKTWRRDLHTGGYLIRYNHGHNQGATS